MIKSSDEKKQLFYMIVSIMTLITLIIGATLAYISFVASQKEESTVLYTGTLAINYIDGVYIKDPTLYPMKNVNYNTKNDVYRNSFQISSTGSLDQTISIDLVITKNEFKEGELKYVIYNSDGKLISTGNVQKSGPLNLTNNVFLAHNSSTTYTLIIWWSSDQDYNVAPSMGSVVSGHINVEAIQAK